MYGLTKLKPKVAPVCPTNMTGTKHYPKTGREPQHRTGLKETSSQATAGHRKHKGHTRFWATGDNALQDLFFIRSLLSGPGNTAEFPNIQQHTDTELDKMRRQEYAPNQTG